MGDDGLNQVTRVFDIGWQGQMGRIVNSSVSCDLANLPKKDLAEDEFALCEKTNSKKVNCSLPPFVGMMGS